MTEHSSKIPVGISSCLLGEQVRYDGGHKNNEYIRQTLGQYFDFRAFCPEVASGMSIPRPTIQLRYSEHGIRSVGVKDHRMDVTDQIQSACAQQQWLNEMCGYILKKDSPSCGMERVRIYRDNNYADRTGTGLFAQFIKDRYPLLPMEEEGRLGDPHLRENFIQRVYVFYRWKKLISEPITEQRLTDFHARHKLIAMSHDQNKAKALGRLLANSEKTALETIAAEYINGLMNCLRIVATRGNHVNVLQHIQGYLKKSLDKDDKAELKETVDRYQQGQLPLIVPITLLRHHFRRQPDKFIGQSYYMSPYPEEISLLNQI